jgi:hypothetical protein
LTSRSTRAIAVAAVDPVLDPVPAELQVGDVAFLEVHDALGDAGERHRVGGEERLAVADAQHQRRAEPRADDAMRLVAREHRDRVRAVQLDDGALDGVEQVAVVVHVDEVRDHLGVGLAREGVAARLEHRAQRLVVLDDAVVHDRDAAGPGRHRVAPRAVRESADARCARRARRASPSACARSRSSRSRRRAARARRARRRDRCCASA